MLSIWKTVLLCLVAAITFTQFVKAQDTGPRFCDAEVALFVNEPCPPGASCTPTLGVVLYQQQAITLSQFVRTINNSQCSTVEFSLDFDSTFPMEPICANGTVIFARSRVIGEACIADEHCVSSAANPVRCISGSCQTVQPVTLQRNASCSISGMKYGALCGSGLGCDTYFTSTCQSLCSSTSPCESNYYCALTFTDDTFENFVEVCTPIRKVGESCAHSNIFYYDSSYNCEQGTRCSPETSTCVPITRIGEACRQQGECEKGSECFVSEANPTCKALPDIGAPCDELLGCRNSTTSYCSPESSLCALFLTSGASCNIDDSLCQPQLLCALNENGATCSETGQSGQPCLLPLYACNQGLFCNPFQISNGSVGYRCESELPKSGAICDPKIGCAAGLKCGISSNSTNAPLCLETRQLNEPCTHPAQCPSNHCEAGICKAAKQVDEACDINSAPCQAPLLCSFGKCIQPFSIAEGRNCSGVTYPLVSTTRIPQFDQHLEQKESQIEPIYHECSVELTCDEGICKKFAPCDVTTDVLPLTANCHCKDGSSVAIYSCYWELQNYTNCLNVSGQVERADLPLTQCVTERTNYYQCRFRVLGEAFPGKTLGEVPNVNPTVGQRKGVKSGTTQMTCAALCILISLVVLL